MKSNKVIGWCILGVGVFLLVLGILSDANVNLGPLNYLYYMLDYISISSFIRLLAETFGFVIRIIGKFFWYIVLIVIGSTIVFGSKSTHKKEVYEFDEDGRPIFEKRLTRRLKNRKLTGVCAGLADYLNIDATIIRLIFMFGFVFGGGMTGIIYLVLTIIIPETY